MSSFWLRELRRVFGEDRVEDALEGTALEPLGKEHNFGLWVVRQAITAAEAEAWIKQSTEDIAQIASTNPHQHRAVALQGSGTKRKNKHYNTVQACFGCCQCKYAYAGTLRHDVYALHMGYKL